MQLQGFIPLGPVLFSTIQSSLEHFPKVLVLFIAFTGCIVLKLENFVNEKLLISCFFNCSSVMGPGRRIVNVSRVQSTIVLACNALHFPNTIPSISGSCSNTSSLHRAVLAPDWLALVTNKGAFNSWITCSKKSSSGIRIAIVSNPLVYSLGTGFFDPLKPGSKPPAEKRGSDLFDS